MATTYTETLTNGDDTFTDAPSRNTLIIALAGNDVIDGGDGDDVIYGGAGNDTLFGGEGSDEVYGDQGDDLLYMDENYLDVGVVDTYYGGEGNDRFVGPYYTDSKSQITAYGGVGDDTYSFVGGMYGTKVIEKAGEGIDTIILGFRSGEVTLPDNVENFIAGWDGSAKGTGNSLDNVMISTNERVVLYGLAGNDTLTGGDNTRLGNELYGGSGNDTLNGAPGEDILDGGTGNDILKGASLKTWKAPSDKDTLTGGKGNDIFYADTSDTIIENSREGTDTLFYVPRSDLSTDFYLPENVENMTMMDPDYAVTGTVYFDGFGNDQRNRIEGNSYDNALFGNGGNDFLIGGDGDDELDGGTGRDKYDGGAGNDQFKYDPADFRDIFGENQYVGGAGTDSLVLPIAFPKLNLTKLPNNMIRGIDVIEAEPLKGGSASLILTADDVVAISDNGTLRIEDGFGAGILSVYSKDQGWTLSGTEIIDDVTYDVYKVGQATLVVDADLGGVIS